MAYYEPPYGKTQWHREGNLQQTASKEQKPWFWQHKELNAASNHMSGSFPIWASDETTVFAHTYIETLYDSETQSPTKSFLSSWPTEIVR